MWSWEELKLKTWSSCSVLWFWCSGWSLNCYLRTTFSHCDCCCDDPHLQTNESESVMKWCRIRCPTSHCNRHFSIMFKQNTEPPVWPKPDFCFTTFLNLQVDDMSWWLCFSAEVNQIIWRVSKLISYSLTHIEVKMLLDRLTQCDMMCVMAQGVLEKLITAKPDSYTS